MVTEGGMGIRVGGDEKWVQVTGGLGSQGTEHWDKAEPGAGARAWVLATTGTQRALYSSLDACCSLRPGVSVFSHGHSLALGCSGSPAGLKGPCLSSGLCVASFSSMTDTLSVSGWRRPALLRSSLRNSSSTLVPLPSLSCPHSLF